MQLATEKPTKKSHFHFWKYEPANPGFIQLAKPLHVGTIFKRYLPTFCWQTYYEIITFVEQVNENISDDTIKNTLNYGVKKGRILRRKVMARRRNITVPCYEYRRNPDGR